MTTTRATIRLDWLDGMKGISILWIVFFHAFSLLDFPWLFQIFAPFYNWFNAQGVWRESCARLARYFPPKREGTRFRVVDLGCGPGQVTDDAAGSTSK